MQPGIGRSAAFVASEKAVAVTMTKAEYLAALNRYSPLGYSRDQVEQLLGRSLPFARPYASGYNANIPTLYPSIDQMVRNAVSIRETVPLVNYVLELENKAVLPYWKDGTWTQTLNEPDVLTFTYPATADWAAELKRPSKIILRDGDGYPLQVFDIQGALPHYVRSGGEVTVQVEAKGPLARLADDWVTEYKPGGGATLAANVTASATTLTVQTGEGASFPSSGTFTVLVDEERISIASRDADTLTVATGGRGADGSTAAAHAAESEVGWCRTIKDHATALLETFQESYRKVGVGTIYRALDGEAVYVEFSNRTLLDCIRELYHLSGNLGQYTVTANGAFIWAERLGRMGEVVRLGYNLRGLERIVHDENLVTRLYVYGRGLGSGKRIKLSDKSGNAHDYVERNTGTYGVIARHMVLEEVHDAHTLDTVADALIVLLSEPDVSYQVNALDLYVANAGPLITIGCLVNIVDDDLDIDDEESVISVRRNLANPLDIQYELARSATDMETVIKTLVKRIVEAENRNHAKNVTRGIQTGDIESVPRVNLPTDAAHREGDLRTGATGGDSYLKYYQGGAWQDIELTWREYDGP